MNDNEIIKALECCDNCFCDECCEINTLVKEMTEGKE